MTEEKEREISSFGKNVISENDLKACPMCAEKVMNAAKICRYCSHKFIEKEVIKINDKKEPENNTVKFLLFTVIFVVVLVFIYRENKISENNKQQAAINNAVREWQSGYQNSEEKKNDDLIQKVKEFNNNK